MGSSAKSVGRIRTELRDGFTQERRETEPFGGSERNKEGGSFVKDLSHRASPRSSLVCLM